MPAPPTLVVGTPWPTPSVAVAASHTTRSLSNAACERRAGCSRRWARQAIRAMVKRARRGGGARPPPPLATNPSSGALTSPLGRVPSVTCLLSVGNPSRHRGALESRLILPCFVLGRRWRTHCGAHGGRCVANVHRPPRGDLHPRSILLRSLPAPQEGVGLLLLRCCPQSPSPMGSLWVVASRHSTSAGRLSPPCEGAH